MSATSPSSPSPENLPREEFERFMVAFTHEIRNRLNALALEAADLAEQAGPQADSARMQKQIQECSAFLKKVRLSLAPDDVSAPRESLAEFVRKMKERS